MGFHNDEYSEPLDRHLKVHLADASAILMFEVEFLHPTEHDNVSVCNAVATGVEGATVVDCLY